MVFQVLDVISFPESFSASTSNLDIFEAERNENSARFITLPFRIGLINLTSQSDIFEIFSIIFHRLSVIRRSQFFSSAAWPASPAVISRDLYPEEM